MTTARTYKVKDFFNEDGIQLCDLEDLSSKSNFWSDSYDFTLAVWEKHFILLSEKQKAWLEKIRDGFNE